MRTHAVTQADLTNGRTRADDRAEGYVRIQGLYLWNVTRLTSDTLLRTRLVGWSLVAPAQSSHKRNGKGFAAPPVGSGTHTDRKSNASKIGISCSVTQYHRHINEFGEMRSFHADSLIG